MCKREKMIEKREVILREVKLEDIKELGELMHPSREFNKYDGPYFRQDTEEELLEKIKKLEQRLKAKEPKPFGSRKIIADKETDEIIGVVSYYWKSKETNWMEVGICIYNEKYWGIGLGYQALKKWIDQVFDSHQEIVRLGLTTWSGNVRMMKLAEKLHLNKEAVYRKARIVNGQYFDSVSYGILREEWEALSLPR